MLPNLLCMTTAQPILLWRLQSEVIRQMPDRHSPDTFSPGCMSTQPASVDGDDGRLVNTWRWNRSGGM